jgi:hypothetical protein
MRANASFFKPLSPKSIAIDDATNGNVRIDALPALWFRDGVVHGALPCVILPMRAASVMVSTRLTVRIRRRK